MLKKYAINQEISEEILIFLLQAFINTAREIYSKIQDGVFDPTNEVNFKNVY